jgi:hypothetical protein
LAFSLGDRKAHRDRPTYFREHATEVADVLRLLPIICEKFLVIAERILKELKFEYKKGSKSIFGKYNVEGLTSIDSSQIIIEDKEAKRIMRTILSSLDRNPRDALPLNQVLIVEGASIDKQIAIMNAIINRKLVKIDEPLYLDLSEKGKESLGKLINKNEKAYIAKN